MTRVTLDTGDHGIQLQLEYGSIVDEDTGGAVTANTEYVIISKAEAWIDANGYPFYDSSNKLTYTGGWVTDGSTSNIDMDTSGSIRIKSLPRQHRVPEYGSTASYAIELEVTGINAAGTLSGGKSFTQPRLPYHTPSVPVVTLADTGVVTITGNQTDPAKDKFWETTDWRLSTDNVYADWHMNAAGSTKTYSFSPVGNKRYEVAVRAKNDDATSSYGYSAAFYTTPAAPTVLVAARQSTLTTVRLSWNNNAAHPNAYLVERSLDGAGFVQIGTTAATVFDDLNLPQASTAEYRVRVQTPAPVATSGYSAVASVGTAYTAPDKPTSVTLTSVGSTWQVNVAPGQTNPALDKYWETITWQLSIDDGEFVTQATLPGTTQVIPISNLLPNRRYKAQVRANNVGGSSAYTASGNFHTAVPAPEAVAATRRGSTPVVDINWVNTATWAVSYTVQRSMNGGAWTTLGTSTTPSYVDNNLPVHAYAVYRITASTSATVAISPVSTPSNTVPASETNTAGIPGIGKIYAGTKSVYKVMSRDQVIWLG